VEKKIAMFGWYSCSTRFGERGIGKERFKAVQFAREMKFHFWVYVGNANGCNRIFQKLLGLKNANYTEMDENTPDPVIS